MKKQKILIATTNPAKLADYQNLLKSLSLEVIGLKDLGIKTNIKERGRTFAKNAILKAKTHAKATGLITLADDGGLEIDYLNGWPGIKSRNIGNKRRTDKELIDLVLKKLKGVPKSKRGAQIRGIIALAHPSGRVVLSEGKIRGLIADKPTTKKLKGYPYRSIFYLPEFKKIYLDLSKKDYNLINHRQKALAKIIRVLKKWISI